MIFDGVMNLAFMRIVRLARLTRGVRILRSTRSLYLLISGVMSSIQNNFLWLLIAFRIADERWDSDGGVGSSDEQSNSIL